MHTYETSATVEDHGQIHVAGVPFAPGTEVEITIIPKQQYNDDVTVADDAAVAAARERMQELFQTVRGFRGSPRLPREELHERGSLH